MNRDFKVLVEFFTPARIKWDDFKKSTDFHIDHIVPLNYFDYESYNCLDFHLAWRLENLRVLSAKENLTKQCRIDLPEQQELLKEVNFYRSYPDMYRI